MIPGPGAYSPQTRSVSPAYSLGRSSRAGEARAVTPSPADYSPTPLSTSTGCVIGGSKREAGEQGKVSPGPCAYNPAPQSTSPHFSMKMKLSGTSRPTETPVNLTQGPGAYSPSSTATLTKARTAVIGSEAKLALAKEIQRPPPGSYEIKRDLSPSGFKFGKSLRSQEPRSESPGPAAYRLPSAIANVPAYLLPKYTA